MDKIKNLANSHFLNIISEICSTDDKEFDLKFKELQEFFITNNKSINIEFSAISNKNALTIAVEKKCPKIVSFLLINGANPRIITPSEKSLVAKSIENNTNRITKLLITYGANTPKNALISASRKGDFPLAEILINTSHELERRDVFGNMAIFYLAIRGNIHLISLMLKQKPSLVSSTNSQKETLLMLAAKHSHHKLVDYLAEFNNDNINHISTNGKSALSIAACRHDIKSCINLIRHGALPPQHADAPNLSLNLGEYAYYVEYASIAQKNINRLYRNQDEAGFCR